MAPGLQLKAGNSSGNFSHNGQNKYRPIRKRKHGDEDNVIDFNYFAHPDRRMKFENGKDPAIMAFEHIDKLPLHKVAIEVTKETIKDIRKIDFKEKITNINDGLSLIVNSILDNDMEARAVEADKKDIDDRYKENLRTKFSLLKQRR